MSLSVSSWSKWSTTASSCKQNCHQQTCLENGLRDFHLCQQNATGLLQFTMDLHSWLEEQTNAWESIATVEVLDIQSLVWYTASSLPYPYELQCPIIFEKRIHLIAGHDTHGPTKTVLRCFLPLLAMSSLTQLATLELCPPNMHKPIAMAISTRDGKNVGGQKLIFPPYKPHPCMLRPIQTTQQYRDKHKIEFSSWVVEHRTAYSTKNGTPTGREEWFLGLFVLKSWAASAGYTYRYSHRDIA